jgi:hypothetical protein
MWKLTPLAAIALIGLIAFIAGSSSAPATAGVPLPPPDVDELDINGELVIDLGAIQGPTEAVELNGYMLMERGDPVDDMIPIEIVELSLIGNSSLLGPDTPVAVMLNPSTPATGVIGSLDFPAESFFDVFFDIKIGEFQHYTALPTTMTSVVDGIPAFDSKWASGPTQNPIIDATNPKNVPGLLLDTTIWVKPPPVKLHSITVLKVNDEDRQPLPGWEMNLYDGPDCSGIPIDSATTGSDGLVDFNGLPPGLYSVLEKPQPGWNPVGEVCQAVDLGGAVGGAGDFAPCPIDDLDFPQPGCDEFDSGAQVNVEINFSGETDTITLNGPTVIQRSGVDGQVAGNGRNVIQTEIVQLDLSGFSPLLGPVSVRQSPDARSLGEIEEQENETPREMDFPADSFFDVFFEIELEDAGLVLHNDEAFRLACKIDEIPPLLCFYQPPVPNPIDLLGPDGAKVAKLVHGVHIPLPPKEVLIVFRNAPKPDVTPTPTPDEKLYSINVLKVNDEDRQPLPGWEMNLYDGPDCSDNFIDSETTGSDGIAEFTGLPAGLYSVLEKSQPSWNPVGDPCQPVELGGAVGGAGDFADCPIDDLDFPLPGCDEFDSGAQVNIEINVSGDTSAVTLNGPTTIQRGPIGDTEPNGLDDVQTEIIQLDLTGVSPLLGPVVVRQSPQRRSLGAIEEQENRIQGPLDFPAESFFDVFFEIELPDAGLVLHNTDPFRLECKIDEIPPILCFYQPPVPDPIELYNEAGVKIATIVHGLHIPLPPKKVLIVFRNRPKPDTPTPMATATTGGPTPTVTPTRPVVPTVTATPQPPNDGDVNKDGTTNSIDASLLLQFEAGIITAVDHPENADVNRNGQINSVDATLILQLDAGLIPSLPV